MALTATATHPNREDILKDLRIPHALVLETSLDRPHLKYEVIAKTKQPLEQLGELVKNRFANFCGIVYCLSKSECVDVAKYLNEKWPIKMVYYHDGLAACQREAAQKEMAYWRGPDCMCYRCLWDGNKPDVVSRNGLCPLPISYVLEAS